MTFDGEREDIGIQLPQREAEILDLAAQGLTDRQISAELGISKDTVSTYWRRILLRYNASSRTQVVARAVEDELSGKLNQAERLSARLKEEIHERSLAQAKDLFARNLLTAVQTALVSFVSGTPSPVQIFDHLLKEILAVTESEFGFISEVVGENDGEPMIRGLAMSNIAWDEQSRIRYETELTIKFSSLNRENLLGAAIAARRPMIVNDPKSDPKSGGIPDGHAVIESLLTLPVLNGEEVVGLIGIANRPGGFEDGLVTDLEPLVATCGALIAGLRAQERRSMAEAGASEALSN